MARLIRKAKQYGFTLVELLIVVAIIGVLSTIGIPSFRRMVQKSKKSEAKVNLGGLYTSEQAFFSEYGAYGNNLNKMGYAIDGNPANLMYKVGFLQGGCNSVPATLPTKAVPLGAAIFQAYPQYYTGAPVSAFGSAVMANNCLPAAGLLTAVYPSPIVNVRDVAPGTANAFIAVAAGVIRPDANKSGAGAPTLLDYWAVNEGRLISNIQDGVQ